MASPRRRDRWRRGVGLLRGRRRDFFVLRAHSPYPRLLSPRSAPRTRSYAALPSVLFNTWRAPSSRLSRQRPCPHDRLSNFSALVPRNTATRPRANRSDFWPLPWFLLVAMLVYPALRTASCTR